MSQDLEAELAGVVGPVSMGQGLTHKHIVDRAPAYCKYGED
jgi:hypothetical protein